MFGVPKDIYSYSLEFFFLLNCNFSSARFGLLGIRNCNKNVVCLSCVSNEICHWPSGHSFGLICVEFGTLVYLWDTWRHSRKIFDILIFSVFIGFLVFLGLGQK